LFCYLLTLTLYALVWGWHIVWPLFTVGRGESPPRPKWNQSRPKGTSIWEDFWTSFQFPLDRFLGCSFFLGDNFDFLLDVSETSQRPKGP